MNKKLSAACAASLALGFILGHFYAGGLRRSPKSTATRQQGFRLTHPLLDCDVSGEGFLDLALNKKKLQRIVDAHLLTGTATHISLYYRDLNNGPWLGIDHDAKFAPASLLKVPILLAYLKQAESDLGLLKRQAKHEHKDINTLQLVVPSRGLKDGKTYTVEDYLRYMILYSDNQAAYFLLTQMDPVALDAAYTDLGVEAPTPRTPEDWITVKKYASFFRILYNSSYLNRGMSEKALDFLSQTEFKDGIVAGVPPGTLVSHKFGERMDSTKTLFQMHDCGIVYYTPSPYLLCIMTQGKNIPDLISSIKDLSAAVYQQVDSLYKTRSIP